MLSDDIITTRRQMAIENQRVIGPPRGIGCTLCQRDIVAYMEPIEERSTGRRFWRIMDKDNLTLECPTCQEHVNRRNAEGLRRLDDITRERKAKEAAKRKEVA